MKRILFGIGRALGATGRATIALVGICGVVAALANYAVTLGSGTNFGSIVVSTVHYAQQLICDSVTPTQCVSVSAAGAAKVDGSAVTQPVSVSGGATSANQSSQITQETAINTVLGAQADAACGTATGTCTLQALIKFLNTSVNSALPSGTNTIGTTGQLPYPVGAVPITASATGTTAATTATLAGAAGKTTYICGYSIRANATAATTVTNTITGVITATLSSVMWVAPLASGLGVDEQIFSPCIPASATNTGIAIVSGAPGSGGTVSSKGWGYQL